MVRLRYLFLVLVFFLALPLIAQQPDQTVYEISLPTNTQSASAH